SETAKVGLLVLLKTFQRLGYFVTLAEVPRRIVAHITTCAGLPAVPEGLETYDTGHSRSRHLAVVRARLEITAYRPAARRAMCPLAVKRAQAKEDLAGLINVILVAFWRTPEHSLQEDAPFPAFIAQASFNRARSAAAGRADRSLPQRRCRIAGPCHC